VGWFLESRVAVRVNRGARYVAVSEVTRGELVGLGVDPETISVAYNGVPPMPEHISCAPHQNPRLVVLSRLVPHKRIEHAITAVAALRAEIPDLQLTVIGGGWWEGQLKALRDRLDLVDEVSFLGHVDERRKYEELSRAWVHVLPSVKEGWGLSIVEAARVGVPSVAYRDAGGVRESIVDGATGLLADDEAHFVHCVRTLLTQGALRSSLGRRAQARTERFTWEAAAAAIERALLGDSVETEETVPDAA
jgi:glycosyltransferase involved in cell wall biosynthesis